MLRSDLHLKMWHQTGLIIVTVLCAVIVDLMGLPTAKTNQENSELQFFQRIQGLNLEWEEIIGSYKNVSAEVETAMCKSKCKTAAALWVLQDFQPCELIEKVDCPRGLVCCTSDPTVLKQRERVEAIKVRSTQIPGKVPLAHIDAIFHDEITDVDSNDSSEHTAAQSGDDEVVTNAPFMHKLDDQEQDFFYPEPILDPIPNDEFP